MGTFETPVTMQTGARHKYFSSPVSTQSESDKASRLIPRVGNQTAVIEGKINLIPKNAKKAGL